METRNADDDVEIYPGISPGVRQAHTQVAGGAGILEKTIVGGALDSVRISNYAKITFGGKTVYLPLHSPGSQSYWGVDIRETPKHSAYVDSLARISGFRPDSIEVWYGTPAPMVPGGHVYNRVSDGLDIPSTVARINVFYICNTISFTIKKGFISNEVEATPLPEKPTTADKSYVHIGGTGIAEIKFPGGTSNVLMRNKWKDMLTKAAYLDGGRLVQLVKIKDIILRKAFDIPSEGGSERCYFKLSETNKLDVSMDIRWIEGFDIIPRDIFQGDGTIFGYLSHPHVRGETNFMLFKNDGTQLPIETAFTAGPGTDMTVVYGSSNPGAYTLIVTADNTSYTLHAVKHDVNRVIDYVSSLYQGRGRTYRAALVGKIVNGLFTAESTIMPDEVVPREHPLTGGAEDEGMVKRFLESLTKDENISSQLFNPYNVTDEQLAAETNRIRGVLLGVTGRTSAIKPHVRKAPARYKYALYAQKTHGGLNDIEGTLALALPDIPRSLYAEGSKGSDKTTVNFSTGARGHLLKYVHEGTDYHFVFPEGDNPLEMLISMYRTLTHHGIYLPQAENIYGYEEHPLPPPLPTPSTAPSGGESGKTHNLELKRISEMNPDDLAVVELGEPLPAQPPQPPQPGEGAAGGRGPRQGQSNPNAADGAPRIRARA